MAINLVQGKQIATASWAINAISSSYAQTASYALNAGGGGGSTFPFTGSAQITGSLGVTGSLNVTQGITGSLFGTASFATNSLTSSFVTGSNVFGPFGSNSTISASFAVSSSRAVTSSFAISSSFATTSSFAISASNSLSSSFATIAGNVSSISTSITDNVNNYVLTATGTGVINGESNLQFDGTTLDVNGALENGFNTGTIGLYSHAEGNRTIAYGDYSHAEGDRTYTAQLGYIAERVENGVITLASSYGDVANQFSGGFILYDDTDSLNVYGFVRLQYASVVYNDPNTIINLIDQTKTDNSAKGVTIGIPGFRRPLKSDTQIPIAKIASHAEGDNTIADGNFSHAEGSGSTSIGDYSHAEGSTTQAIGSGSHTEGNSTLAVGNYSHAEGLQTQTINPNSHTEGNSTYTGQYGYEATYDGSPGEYRLLSKYGNVTSSFTNTYVIVDDSFEENTVGLKEVGFEFETVNYDSGNTFITLSEGLTTSKLYIGISGVFAPVIADKIIPVNKQSSHAEGSGSFALGTGAHAEGYNTRAIGNYSNTKGLGTIAEGEGQVVIGSYNVPTASSAITFIVGAGGDENDRRNAMYVQDRDVFMTRDLTVTRTITGNLSGNATTATTAITSSYITSSNVFGPFGANSIISASFAVSSSRAVSSSFAISSSFAVTSSFATTASYISPTFISASAAASGFGSGGGGDTSGLLTTASFNSYTSSNTSQFAGTASFTTTASYALNGGVTQIVAGTNVTITNGGSGSVTINAAGSGGSIDTGSFATTGSNTFIGNQIITGSLTVTQPITGSLFGTSSFAATASFVETAQTASFVQNAISASYVLQAVSSSFATTASYASNGGVTQLLAGPNISLSPTTGLGQVTISSTGGGGGFNTATGSYGSFYSTQTQTNVASTARSMSLNTTDISNGVSVSGSTNPFNTYIKTENAGVYDIQFSAQVDKTDSGTDEIWIWLRKNGTNLTDTATSLQLVGNGAHYVAAWNFFVNAAANDYFQLMWYSPDANVRLHAESAFGVVPGIPSLIVTANRVDQFLSNTGSFSGSFTGQFTGSLFGTASFATTASYASNGGVTSIVAGTNITVSSATGAVTISSTGGGGGGTDLGLVQAMTVGLQNIF